MARRPSSSASPSPPSVDVSTPPDAGQPSAILTLDEAKSPLFRSLRDIEAIEEPELRLAAALDRLDAISKLALDKSRVTPAGNRIHDPDCHAAIKVEEVAHRLLSVEPRHRKIKAPDLSVFEKQPALALAKGS